MTTRPAIPAPEQDGRQTLIEPAGFRPPGAGLELPRPRVPWLRAGAFLLVLLVAWAAWFVLTARSVAIETTPGDAAVTVRQWPAPRVGDHWLVRAGERRVTVSAPGYVTFSGVITVTDAQVQTHRIELEPLPGKLNVTLAPVARATLYIDGREHGAVPGLVEDVPAGEHRVEVRAARYLPFETQLVVEGKGIEQRLDVRLDPAWADVTLDSKPSGAAVSVDGEAVGATPITTGLLAGRRVLALALPGFKPWKQTLAIVPGKDVDLGEVVLAKADGAARIESAPSAASVTVDGEFRGRTPLELTLGPDEQHTVRLIKEGYKPLEQRVSVASGARRELELVLEPELAVVHLITSPENAALTVGGKPSGSATQTLELPTHEHEIVVSAPGYATFKSSITPRKGVEKRFRIRLKTAGEVPASGAASASTPPRSRAPGGRASGTVTTHAGQTLKLFEGGRVTLGSSRRTPGHRANEVIRAAELTRPFYLGVKEVSNAEFREFLAAHRSGEFKGQSLDADPQAVANVSWASAALYCNWLSRRDGLPPFYQIKYGDVLGINPDSTGYRMPTEAEWEWAAKVPPKGEPSTFPWGQTFPPRGRSGNYADQSAAGIMGGTIDGYDDGFAVAAPVGSFSANLRGLYDLDGNVAEWVHDFYDAAPLDKPSRDPLGPPTGAQHVIKGGSWAQGSASALRASYRDHGAKARDDVGFRLARYAR
ncbi:MAG: PEGA domain-containing protein [Gammaproteobacteria bacterium]